MLRIFMEQNEDARNRSATYGNLTKPACLIPGENPDYSIHWGDSFAFYAKKKIPLSDFRQIARNSRTNESLFSKQTSEEII